MVFAVLMYVEFGIGEWLEERPLLYAVTHQVRGWVGGLCVYSVDRCGSELQYTRYVGGWVHCVCTL